ncbi:MAG TPA: hypothetical protein PK156_07390 [Polyangium sp.]|nr:hypothetical protein [Polyangium sp.]
MAAPSRPCGDKRGRTREGTTRDAWVPWSSLRAPRCPVQGCGGLVRLPRVLVMGFQHDKLGGVGDEVERVGG